ncbi:nitrate ABC transporter substrate-binding protein [Burkholderia sp. SRS-46]|nr:nitrate ABC transporter substrate-binding protein [Burkholderia sp. SRS-46]
MKTKVLRACLLFLAALLVPSLGRAEQAITLYLNWVPGPEHAPLFYAQKMGWYEQAGVKLTIAPGAGSGRTLNVVADKPNTIGVADFLSLLVARSKDNDAVAVMNLFANSPYIFYWLKDSGIRSIHDLPGHKLGAPGEDMARRLWPALARANGIDPSSITWVEVANDDKVQALRDRKVDVVTNYFLDSYSLYPKAFGAQLGELPWRDAGFNPYSNSLFVPAHLLKDDPQTVSAVVRATQRAQAACLANPAPCIDALVQANPNIQRNTALANWNAGRQLFYSAEGQLPLGAFDPVRVQRDYEVAHELFKLSVPADQKTAFDNEFLDTSIKPPR